MCKTVGYGLAGAINQTQSLNRVYNKHNLQRPIFILQKNTRIFFKSHFYIYQPMPLDLGQWWINFPDFEYAEVFRLSDDEKRAFAN
jgi:hypothetical protein